jgi:hypothetical protein
MARFNLLKTLGLQRVADQALVGIKRDIIREIDRAVGKLQSGESGAMVVQQLHSTLADILSSAALPFPLGPVLASILMMAPWDRLVTTPSALVVGELGRLRKQVEGARL